MSTQEHKPTGTHAHKLTGTQAHNHTSGHANEHTAHKHTAHKHTNTQLDLRTSIQAHKPTHTSTSTHSNTHECTHGHTKIAYTNGVRELLHETLRSAVGTSLRLNIQQVTARSPGARNCECSRVYSDGNASARQGNTCRHEHAHPQAHKHTSTQAHKHTRTH